MNNALDKVSTALRWTLLLIGLVLCFEGRPPARGQDGTTQATIGGISNAVALQNKDMAYFQAQQHVDEAAIARLVDKMAVMDRDLYTFEARVSTFGLVIAFIATGQFGIKWYNDKKRA